MQREVPRARAEPRGSSGYDSSALFPEEFRDLPVLVKPYQPKELAALLRAAFALPGPT